MGDMSEAYTEARERIAAIAEELSDDDLQASVPACPAWTATDVISHLAGIAVDTMAGVIEGAGSEAYTSRQVEARKGKDVGAVIEEWREAKLETILDGLHPAIAGGIIGDLFTHEQDFRGAVGRPGGHDSKAFEIALDSYTRFLGRRIKEAGLPALTVEAAGTSWVAGKGDPVGTVSGEPFELLRCLTGRRTLDEIRALGWSTDPDPYLKIFAMYGIPDASLSE
ncbi:MAG: maleylpyruvate isomerase family mycothiol-dependent enzyme [Actinomycetota bacterium]